MLRPVVSIAAALLCATPALAGADLETTLTAPSGTYVYEDGRYTVTVANNGNRNAQNVDLVIEMPVTNTTTVQIMGTLGAIHRTCVRVGTTLECDLRRIKKGRSKTVFFEIALPQNSEDLSVYAEASTTSTEDNASDDADTLIASLLNDTVSFSAPFDVHNEHCTGVDLTSYFECTLYPSSITSHDTTLNADGSISFVGAPPGYTGTWSSTGSDELSFTYFYNGSPVADFEGFGVDGDCWEGVTVFTPGPYVSPYRVCVQ